MIADGDAIPEPSRLEAIMADEDNRDGVVILVDLVSKPVKAVRVNITLPQDLLEAIDRVTDNRSRFLAEAAQQRLLGG
jgi:hypothetical protein